MSLRGDALDRLAALEASRLRDRFVAHLRTHADGCLRACAPDHVTASMLVVSSDHSRVLLTLHGRARRWFQLGGHCEPDDRTLVAAALREAREESGIEQLTVDPVPVHLDEHPVPFCSAGPDTHHLDVRFVAVAPAGAEQVVSAGSVDVRWWPVRGLPTSEPSLLALVGSALDRLDADPARIEDVGRVQRAGDVESVGPVEV